MRKEGCARTWTALKWVALAGQNGFLAGDNFPAAHVIVQVDMDHTILPREIATVLDASGAPGAGHYRRRAVDADVNVGGNKAGVLGVGILYRSDQRCAVPAFSGRSRVD